MLIESFLAMTAIIAVASFKNRGWVRSRAAPSRSMPTGIAELAQHRWPPGALGITFFTLAASAFALTSLDTACRLARYTLEELAKCEGFNKVPGTEQPLRGHSGDPRRRRAAAVQRSVRARSGPCSEPRTSWSPRLTLLAIAAWLANQKKVNPSSSSRWSSCWL